MKVNTFHPEYVRWLPIWEKCRDVSEGEEAVKDKKTAYLPALSGHVDERGWLRRDSGYMEYLADTWFYGATGRTIEGLTGLVFRRPPSPKVPDKMTEFMDDVTGSGLSFQGFCESVIEEVQKIGRVGVLVENTNKIPRRSAEQTRITPFWMMYTAESIVNWTTERIGPNLQLTKVVLFEYEIVDDPDDEFSEDLVAQYRVLDLVDGGNGTRYYRQRIYRQLDSKKVALEPGQIPVMNPSPTNTDSELWQQFGDDLFPTVDGQKMTEIPFVFFGARDTGVSIQRPPLLDLVNSNLAWYRTCANYRWGLKWAGCPTPIFVGVVRQPGHENDPLPMGSSQAIELQLGGSAQFMEFTGQGLSALKTALDDLESLMAVLGARMLAPEKKQVETAETAAIHRHGETSALASLVGAVETGVNRLGNWTMLWAGLSGDFKANLNDKFIPFAMDALTINALVGAWQAGAAIALPDLHELWRESEYIGPERDFETVMSDIESETPRTGTVVNPADLLSRAQGDVQGSPIGGTKAQAAPEPSVKSPKPPAKTKKSVTTQKGGKAKSPGA
jgi:hypothetical protein